jgi:hypothetical protein
MMREDLARMALLIFYLSVPACAATNPSARGEEPECHTGQFALLPGPEPVPVLTAPDGVRLLLVAGAVRLPESLEGATVEVCGAIDRDATGRFARLALQRFDLIAIDGQPALLGTLAIRDGDVLLLKDDRTWRLSGSTAGLRSREGERIWVSGRIGDEEIHVHSYGLVP